MKKNPSPGRTCHLIFILYSLFISLPLYLSVLFYLLGFIIASISSFSFLILLLIPSSSFSSSFYLLLPLPPFILPLLHLLFLLFLLKRVSSTLSKAADITSVVVSLSFRQRRCHTVKHFQLLLSYQISSYVYVLQNRLSKFRDFCNRL